MSSDAAPDPIPASMALSIGAMINWQNETFRPFGLWKRWPAHNIHFQKLRLAAGEITQEKFEELRRMFTEAAK